MYARINSLLVVTFPGGISIILKVASGNFSYRKVFSLLGIALLFCIVLCTPASAETYTVCPSGCNFTSIQEAINFASDGDTIEVMSGTYNEAIVVNRSVTLKGIDSDGELPDIGKYGEPVMVTISAPGVTFEQFWVHGAAKNALALEADVVRVHEVYFAIHRPDEVTDPVVTGTGLAGVEISDCMMTSTGALGIFLLDCSQVFVLDNRVDVNPDTETAPIAISAGYTPQEGSYSDIDIEDNEVDGGAIDVSVLSQSGTTLSPDLYNIRVCNNLVDGSGTSGISVGGDPEDNEGQDGYFLHNVTVEQNTVTNFTAGEGIVVAWAEDGAISGNLVVGASGGSGGSAGLLGADLTGFSVIGNTVTRCNLGISLENARDATLSGNTMADNTLNFGVTGSEIDQYRHSIDTTNTVDGRPIYYLVDQAGPFVDGSTGAGTVYAINCTEVTVRDLALRNNMYGIALIGSDHAEITNVTATKNYEGFRARDGTYVRFGYCSATENDEGFFLSNLDQVRIYNSEASSNTGPLGSGISLRGCSGVDVLQVNANSNSFTGIDISDGNYVNVESGTMDGNEVGLILEGAHLMVTGCNIRDNSDVGIGFLDVDDAGIWNNYFNNDGNVDLHGSVTGAIWNLTKSPGTNIVNGPFIGGNYWANPDGTGWSQVTPDRGDGFTTAPFVLDDNNVDSLPLHLFEGEIPITAPAVIFQPGRYRLVNNLQNSTADCAIRIMASNVTLNGDGHVLGGSNTIDTSGVYLGEYEGGVVNVTVTNLTVTGWIYGFEAHAASDSGIYNCTAEGNMEGVSASQCSRFTVQGCTLADNVAWSDGELAEGGTGIAAFATNSLSVIDSNVSDNGWGEYEPAVGGYGIFLLDCPGSRISGCTIDHNINTGIWNAGSMDTVATGNHLAGNAGNGGIFMAGSPEEHGMNCTVADNTASDSGWGIWLSGNDYVVTGNAVDGCDTGVLLENAENATLSGNEVNDCGFGISLVNAGSATLSGNTMADNTMNFGVTGRDIEYYRHIIDTTNTVDGRPIYYLVDQVEPFVDGSTRAGTVYAVNCTEVGVRDLALSDNEYGLVVIGSNHAQITNVTATGNRIGFLARDSMFTRFGYCSASDNAEDGFLLSDLILSRIYSSEASSNKGTGIAVDDSEVDILQVYAESNAGAGIAVHDADEVTIEDSTIRGNENVGLVLDGGFFAVVGCTIRDNDRAGLWLPNAGGARIFNNYFENYENVDLTGGSITDARWSIEKTEGPNIVDGPFIGGNYWAKPDGTGWSQVTPNRGDGFCTAPFVLDANNVDSLPLHLQATPPFYADFTADPLSGDAPLTVQFTDISSGEPFRWYYQFGDGYSSTSKNPVHTYRNPGTYTVTLSIMSRENTKVITTTTEKVGYITVKGTPEDQLVANFTATPMTGEAPLVVSFTDTSTGNPTGYRYSFGDLSVSAGPDPVHTYRRPGTYDVQLTVWTTAGGKLQSNTTLCRNCITVT